LFFVFFSSFFPFSSSSSSWIPSQKAGILTVPCVVVPGCWFKSMSSNSLILASPSFRASVIFETVRVPSLIAGSRPSTFARGFASELQQHCQASASDYRSS
jgi:hypothetical protein